MRSLLALVFLFIACTHNIKAQTSTFDLKDCESTRKIISIYSGKGSVILPDCFTPADEKITAKKYPGNKPDMVYTIKDIASAITVSFAEKDWPTTKEDLPKIRQAFLPAFEKKGGHDIRSGIITVNGKEFIYYEFTTTREGHDDMYNWVYMSDLDGHFITATFNCLDIFKDKWQAMGKEILSTIKIK